MSQARGRDAAHSATTIVGAMERVQRAGRMTGDGVDTRLESPTTSVRRERVRRGTATCGTTTWSYND
ncbi:MAG TPA: hypothetical protein VGM50_16705, partial [Gemmatimonadaceae bacterium]